LSLRNLVCNAALQQDRIVNRISAKNS
jgi:hypothetical protein